MGSALNDSVNGAILLGAGDIFILSLPVVVGEEMLICDGIHVGV